MTWNGLELLRQCLPSVLASNHSNLEIIVADNASSDGTAEWLSKTYPEIIVVRHPENYAFCRGNNEAVPHATGDYIVFLNNDVQVSPDWLEPIVERMNNDDSIGAAQPKLLQMTSRNHFEYSGAAGGHLDKYGYPFTKGRIFFTMEEDKHQYDEDSDIFWASGAAIVMRKSALDKVGLLDESFVLHMEEIDLCWRLQRHGYRIVAVPESEVYHMGGASLPATDPMKTYYNFRNSLLLLYKNLPPGDWLKIFPRRAIFDLIAVLRLAATGQFKDAGAIVRAYKHAHEMKRQYDDVRDSGSRHIRPDYRRSIIIDYFIRRKRCFSQLPEQAFASHSAVQEFQR